MTSRAVGDRRAIQKAGAVRSRIAVAGIAGDATHSVSAIGTVRFADITSAAVRKIKSGRTTETMGLRGTCETQRRVTGYCLRYSRIVVPGEREASLRGTVEGPEVGRC